MKKILIVLLFMTSLPTFAQKTIEWDDKYELSFSDFQSSATKIGEGNVYSMLAGLGFSFEFSMTTYEFMFTKNFNSKVSNTFNRELSSMVAPDSATAYSLLRWANYEFDLSELYARKIRKKLYESKGALSNSNFFLPIYEELQKEYALRRSEEMTKTDMGQDRDEIIACQQKVNAELELFNDFCKTCKPVKKKK